MKRTSEEGKEKIEVAIKLMDAMELYADKGRAILQEILSWMQGASAVIKPGDMNELDNAARLIINVIERQRVREENAADCRREFRIVEGGRSKRPKKGK